MHLPRALLALLPFWVFIFFFKLSGALHYTLLPVLTGHVFPVWVAGVLIGGAAGIQMLLDVPAGFLLDRFGYVRTLKISTACFLLGALVLAFGIHPWTIALTILLGTIGWLFFTPGMDAYILVNADRKIAGRFMATRDVVASGGVVGGMILLPFLVHTSGPLIATILVIPFVISLVALSRARLDTASIHTEKKISHQSFYIRRHFIHHVLKAVAKLNPVSTVLLLQQFSAATFYGIIWFVIPLMIERMVRTGVLSFGLVVFDLAVLLTGFFLGKLTDTWNKRRLIFWGMLLFSISAALLGFHFGILFIVLGFLATTGDEMASISLWAWLDHIDKEHSEDALVSGVLTLFEDLGWMVGPIIAGLLFNPLGPTWTIAVGAGILFMAWIASSLLLSPSRIPHPVIMADAIKQIHIPRRKPHKS